MFEILRPSALFGLALFVAAPAVAGVGGTQNLTLQPQPSALVERLASNQKSPAEQLADIKKELQLLRFDLMALEVPSLSNDFTTLENMYAKVQASAVTIRTDSVKPGYDVRGSGFFVTATGNGKTGACEIATDNHVLEQTTGQPRVYMPDGSTLTAEVELHDVANDIAVLKISVADPARMCPVLPLGTSANLPLRSAVMRLSPDGPSPGVYLGSDQRSKASKIPLDPGEDANRLLMLFHMTSVEGNSGSAIVDVAGDVVSLTWGSGGGDSTGGTMVESLKRDLDKIHTGK